MGRLDLSESRQKYLDDATQIKETATGMVINYAADIIERALSPGNDTIVRGKFVVINKGGETFVVFSALEQIEFHANIVDRFAREHKLDGQYNVKQDEFFIKSDNWQVSGGGHWELNLDTGMLLLHGRSIAYGVADLNDVASRVANSDAFGNITVGVQ